MEGRYCDMAKKKIGSLFKNDFLNIKMRFFRWRVIRHLIKNNHLKAKELSVLLDLATIIRIPDNKEQEKELKLVCDAYNSLIDGINEEMDQVRRRIS